MENWKNIFLQHFLIISSTEATFLLLSFSKTILLSRSEESWTSEYYLQSGHWSLRKKTSSEIQQLNLVKTILSYTPVKEEIKTSSCSCVFLKYES